MEMSLATAAGFSQKAMIRAAEVKSSTSIAMCFWLDHQTSTLEAHMLILDKLSANAQSSNSWRPPTPCLKSEAMPRCTHFLASEMQDKFTWGIMHDNGHASP